MTERGDLRLDVYCPPSQAYPFVCSPVASSAQFRGPRSSAARAMKGRAGVNWYKDRWNIAVLLLLYTLQGIPMGLTMSIPLLLQTRGVSYGDQAVFSFVRWPYAMKLLWAPIVDFTYLPSFGRRKSWIVPVQFVLGSMLVLVAGSVESLLNNVYALTGVFFVLYFLAATQDIAVDGWALTMLSPENVALASTCNSLGLKIGFFMSYTVFLALSSEEFSNSYLRSGARARARTHAPRARAAPPHATRLPRPASPAPGKGGVLSLSAYMFFWGAVYLVVTVMIAIFKDEPRAPPMLTLATAEGGITPPGTSHGGAGAAGAGRELMDSESGLARPARRNTTRDPAAPAAEVEMALLAPSGSPSPTDAADSAAPSPVAVPGGELSNARALWLILRHAYGKLLVVARVPALPSFAFILVRRACGERACVCAACACAEPPPPRSSRTTSGSRPRRS